MEKDNRLRVRESIWHVWYSYWSQIWRELLYHDKIFTHLIDQPSVYNLMAHFENHPFEHWYHYWKSRKPLVVLCYHFVGNGHKIDRLWRWLRETNQKHLFDPSVLFGCDNTMDWKTGNVDLATGISIDIMRHTGPPWSFTFAVLYSRFIRVANKVSYDTFVQCMKDATPDTLLFSFRNHRLFDNNIIQYVLKSFFCETPDWQEHHTEILPAFLLR
jgi:hypothetical protein